MTAAPTFDLQSHSLHSDGTLPAEGVVARAAAAGVELLALTDHDTVAGIDEALAAARRHGIRVTPAVELSSVHAEYEDLHVLGYELDHRDRGLLDALAEYRDDRARRIWAMVERMRALGFTVDEAPLEARRDAGEPVGRPHLADAVLGHPANAERLAAEGIDGRDALFPAYLVPGAPGYVPRRRPTVEEAIELLHAAGGVAVWAHPFWDVDDPAVTLRAIDRFAAAGLDGVEVFYPTHTPDQTRLLYDACRARGLLATGSSDFHGPEDERFGAFRAFELHGLEPRLGRIGHGVPSN